MNPRDTWCLRGGLTPGIGWFFTYERRLQRLYSWSVEITTFEFVAKNVAIVDARWVCL